MADAEGAVRKGFEEQLSRLLVRHQYVLDSVDQRDAFRLGVRAAEAALAPLIWGRAVGERWDPAETAIFLGLSRQAVQEGVARGALLGVPGRGVMWFPIWQFDVEGGRSWPVIGAVLQVFRNMDPPLEPVVVAAWAQRPEAALGGITPARWVAAGRPDQPVVGAALRFRRHLLRSAPSGSAAATVPTPLADPTNGTSPVATRKTAGRTSGPVDANLTKSEVRRAGPVVGERGP